MFGIDDALLIGLLAGGGLGAGLDKKNRGRGALMGALAGAGLGAGASGLAGALGAGGAGATPASTVPAGVSGTLSQGLPQIAGNPALMGGMQGAGASTGLSATAPELAGANVGNLASTGMLQTPASSALAGAGNPALAQGASLAAKPALMGGQMPAGVASQAMSKGLTPTQIAQMMNNPLTRQLMMRRMYGQGGM